MALTAIARHLLDFCFPGACAVCETSCDGDVRLCEKCRIDLANLESSAACERCGKPLKNPAARVRIAAVKASRTLSVWFGWACLKIRSRR